MAAPTIAEHGSRSSRGGRGTVLVTGTSSGIGRACALHLAEIGFDVLATVRGDADAPAHDSGRLRPLLLDVTDGESIGIAAANAGEWAPAGLAGLVNNAGIAVSGPLEFLPIDDLRRQLEVNLVGHVAVTQAMTPLLRRAGGRIVNVSSSSGRFTTPFLAPYCAAKQGLEAVSDALRVELRPWGIKVILVEPGAIDTPMWSKGMSALDELFERMPPRARELYERQMTALSKAADEAASRARPLDRVTRVVARALTARHPRARYMIGWDDKLQLALARLLPASMYDALMVRMMKLET